MASGSDGDDSMRLPCIDPKQWSTLHLALNDVIQKNMAHFEVCPVGPLGSYLKIHSDQHEELKDRCGVHLLETFIFNQADDIEKLKRFCEKAGLMFLVKCELMSTNLLDAVCTPGSLESCVVFENDLVRNHLRLVLASHQLPLHEIIYNDDFNPPDNDQVTWIKYLPKVKCGNLRTTHMDEYIEFTQDCARSSVLLELATSRQDIIENFGTFNDRLPQFPPLITDVGHFLFPVKLPEGTYDENLFSDELLPWNDTFIDGNGKRKSIHYKTESSLVFQDATGKYHLTTDLSIADPEVELRVLRGFLPRERRLHKRIVYLAKRDPNQNNTRSDHKRSPALIKSAVIVTYSYQQPGNAPSWVPHGNSKKQEPRKRTGPEVVREAKRLLLSKNPQEVLTEIDDPSLSSSKLYNISRALAKHKCRTGPIPATDFDRLVLDIQSAGFIPFKGQFPIRGGKPGTLGDRVLLVSLWAFRLFLSTCPTVVQLTRENAEIEDLKKETEGFVNDFIMDRSRTEPQMKGGIVEMDATFNSSELFLTPVQCFVPSLETVEDKKTPSIPFAYMLSTGRDENDYFFLVDSISTLMKEHAPSKVVRGVLTDDDAAFSRLLEPTAFRMATRAYCSLHKRNNLRHAKGLGKAEVEQLDKALFGSRESDGAEGLIRNGGLLFSLHKETFDADVAEKAKEDDWSQEQIDWVKQQKNIFDHHSLLTELRAGFSGLIPPNTNRIEARNNVIKISKRKETANNVVTRLGSMQKGLADEARRALINKGKWRTTKSNDMDGVIWDTLSIEQQRAHAKKYLTEHLVDASAIFGRPVPDEILDGVTGARLKVHAERVKRCKVVPNIADSNFVVIEKDIQGKKEYFNSVDVVGYRLVCNHPKCIRLPCPELFFCVHRLAIALQSDDCQEIFDDFMYVKSGESFSQRLRRTRAAGAGEKPRTYLRRRGVNASAVPSKKLVTAVRRCASVSRNIDESEDQPVGTDGSIGRRRSRSVTNWNDDVNCSQAMHGRGWTNDSNDLSRSVTNWNDGVNCSQAMHGGGWTNDSNDLSSIPGTSHCLRDATNSPRQKGKQFGNQCVVDVDRENSKISDVSSSFYLASAIDCEAEAPDFSDVYSQASALQSHGQEDQWSLLDQADVENNQPSELCPSPPSRAIHLHSRKKISTSDCSLSTNADDSYDPLRNLAELVQQNNAAIKDRSYQDNADALLCEPVFPKYENLHCYPRILEFKPDSPSSKLFELWRFLCGVTHEPFIFHMQSYIATLKPADDSWVLLWTNETSATICSGCDTKFRPSRTTRQPDNVVVQNTLCGRYYHATLRCLRHTAYHPELVEVSRDTLERMGQTYRVWLRNVLLLELP